MSGLFLAVVNMSITAGILILLILVLRLVLRGAPKWVNVLLWGLAAVRLISPFGIESPLSLMPKTEWITRTEVQAEAVEPDVIDTDLIAALYPGIEISTEEMPSPVITVRRGMDWNRILPYVWLGGMAAILVWMLAGHVRIRRQLRDARHFEDNIYTVDGLASPFVYGLIRPRIFLPAGTDAVSMSCVIAHERTHIGRLDHWWKPFGFLLLSVHWFNPLVWLAYYLFCRDLEMACDASTVRNMGMAERADYSEALLAASTGRMTVFTCPPAFGEIGVGRRIRAVLEDKKPAPWFILLAVILLAVVAVCFLTNPRSGSYSGSDPVRDYICRRVDESFTAEAVKSTLREPFLDADTRDRMLLTLIREEFADFREPIAIEVQAVDYYLYDGKDAMTCTVKATDSEGFTGLLLAYIQPRGNKPAAGVVISDAAIPSILPEGQKFLTLSDVLALAQKGEDLTWEDFSGYKSFETGSGLYIRVYEIDGCFEVWIGGGSPVGKPMYIRLKHMESGEFADITKDDLASFIKRHTSG